MKTTYYSVNGIIRKPKSKKKRILNKWWKKVICWSEPGIVTGVGTSDHSIGSNLLVADYDETMKAFSELERLL